MNTSKKRCLLIGANYFGTDAQLNGCHQDVDDMEVYLRSIGFTEFIIMKDSADDLTFQSPTCPTTANIESAIKTFIASLAVGDYGYIHFSGHGTYTQDDNGDETDGQDECIVPVDYQTAGVIVDDNLKIWVVDALKKGVKLRVVFDCCHSGSALDLPIIWTAGTIFKSENKAAADKDILYFCACKDSQTASDATFGGRPNGALTWALLKCLRAASPTTRWKELVENIRRAIKRADFDQIPHVSMESPSQLLAKIDLI